MKMWKCDVCGYVHRGEEPADVCPICGVGPEHFSSLEIAFSSKSTTGPGEKVQWRCTICNYVHDGDSPGQCPVCGADPDLFVREAVGVSGKPGAPRNVVIIGAGIAGITAAEQVIAQSAGHAEVTIISDEPGLPYYRLNLTRYLALQIPEAALVMKNEEWFSQNRVRLLHGTVREIAVADRRIALDSGKVVAYDALILANGAHPFVPPIPGIHRSGVHAVRTMADARQVLAGATPTARCVIVGCGLLGLEVAGAISARVQQVTVLENAAWAMVRQLNRVAADKLVAYLKTRRIEVMTNVTAHEIVGGESVSGVRLTDGTCLDADMVIVSTGVRPNIHLARLAGISTDRGILVDDDMRTSASDIYAAGDVAEHRGVVYGLWPTSFTQGYVAGTNAVGGSAKFKNVAPFNQLKVLDVDLYSIGRIEPVDGSYSTFEAERDGRYCYLVIHDRRIVGAVLFGDTALAPQISAAIENHVCIDELAGLSSALPGFDEFVKS